MSTETGTHIHTGTVVDRTRINTSLGFTDAAERLRFVARTRCDEDHIGIVRNERGEYVDSVECLGLMHQPNMDIAMARKQLEWIEEQDAAEKRGDPSEWFQGWWVTDAEMLLLEREKAAANRPSSMPFGMMGRLNDVVEQENFCGTAFCLAGHVAMQTLRDGERFSRGGADIAQPMRIDEHGQLVQQPHITVAKRAQAELGISNAAADHLFAEENTAEDMRFLLELMAGERL